MTHFIFKFGYLSFWCVCGILSGLNISLQMKWYFATRTSRSLSGRWIIWRSNAVQILRSSKILSTGSLHPHLSVLEIISNNGMPGLAIRLLRRSQSESIVVKGAHLPICIGSKRLSATLLYFNSISLSCRKYSIGTDLLSHLMTALLASRASCTIHSRDHHWVRTGLWSSPELWDLNCSLGPQSQLRRESLCNPSPYHYHYEIAQAISTLRKLLDVNSFSFTSSPIKFLLTHFINVPHHMNLGIPFFNIVLVDKIASAHTTTSLSVSRRYCKAVAKLAVVKNSCPLTVMSLRSTPLPQQ